jgi:hypothetical protein
MNEHLAALRRLRHDIDTCHEGLTDLEDTRFSLFLDACRRGLSTHVTRAIEAIEDALAAQNSHKRSRLDYRCDQCRDKVESCDRCWREMLADEAADAVS